MRTKITSKTTAKIIIFHGTGGNPNGNWFPWLSNKLHGLGHTVIVPEMPTLESQSLSNWFDALKKQEIVFNQFTIIIGHSVGAVFLLRLLEKISNPIMASVFVAGFTDKLGLPEFDSLNASFIESDYNWHKIKENAGRILCLSGENDPYVPSRQGADLAKNLGVNPILIKNGGHLNAESGFVTFPLLLEKVKLILE